MNYKFKSTILKIKDLFKSNKSIQLHFPKFSGNEKKYLNECIDTSFVSSAGEFVNLFEDKVRTYVKAKKAVAFVNGTSAIQTGLKVVGVKSNHEVITQALTFVATANAIKYNNANPIFLDVDLDTMGLSPKSVENFLNQHGELREEGCYNKISGKKISACLPMHTFGFPMRIRDLIIICNKWKIPVVEDATESFGSLYKGKSTGSFGRVGIFSFNGNKIITSGGGGVLITDENLLANDAKHISTTAKVPHEYEYYHDKVGFNYRMPNINAALACAQIEQIHDIIKSKRKLAKEYSNFFKKEGIKFRTELKKTKANYWLMCLEFGNDKDRNLFLAETNKCNIMTRPIWKLMFDLPMYKNCQKDSQKNARFLEKRIVNIPSGII
tara:strand:+ start:201 stop:1346 length:1146 start_codon:yes stop_codon:yes gene_type:complete